MVEWIIFAVSLLLFLGGAGSMIYTRRGLIRFTDQLSDSLDAMLAGEKEIDFQEDEETLAGKVQMKMRRLYEVMEMKSQENSRQREQLESMISDISHQVKTPIASIRMYHDLLKRTGLGEEKRGEFLAATEHQVDKLEFFMKSMIRMSRLEAGIIKVEPKENSVYGLIAQAVCDVALKAEEKGIEIEADCAEGLSACFDSRWTAEAIFNILDNGVKYTQAGGKLTITAGKTDFYVRIKIKDNGRGIAEAQLPDIFKRFYREPGSADVEGVGIGLYLAREIVMKQNGFIDVRSQKGIGTEVNVNLPVTGRGYSPHGAVHSLHRIRTVK